ncbi:CLUMA_CG001910, isoform A [Clunio marinus]|uniref:CLUMA_CG001910, isoform A n=1 Tax=Clunio marinus TaxID=568069 RepID=A0A1J1HJC5_9DIPT|nr:CLUMA_CG001910, isoform A [Clunio marinus]
MSSNSETPKKHVLYPSANQTNKSPPKQGHHLPKVTLPKVHTSHIQSASQHQYYSLRWNNYQNNLTDMFHELLNSEKFVDVTLACEHNSLKCHKVVLSACSTFFQKLLMDNPCKHPIIIMPPEVAFADLQFIIEFVYRGEIDVSEAELQVS